MRISTAGCCQRPGTKVQAITQTQLEGLYYPHPHGTHPPQSSPHNLSKTPNLSSSRLVIRKNMDTSLTSETLYGDSSSKIWGMYLSKTERVDKERSDRWSANINSMMWFVSYKSYHEIALFSP
jgi:hypothetical protein